MLQRSRSNSVVATVIASVVRSVIQKTIASVGATIVVRRICCVPSAQTAAATSMPMAASGRPASVWNSCQSRSETPSAAQTMPATWRGFSRSPKTATPQSAEKIGIV